MKISVIVPVYNVEDYLEKCLTSIVEQNFQDYEIIIVNDGTTDNSEKIIENFIEKYSEKIIYIKQENKGLGGARNTGICHARGEYLMFVDSDDYIAPNMLQVAYDKILSEQADLLIFDFYLVSESYEVLNEKRGCTGEKIEFTLESYPEILFDCPCTWNKLYHKSLFTKNKITFPNKVWYEDLRTSTKIYTKAKKIVYLKEPLYYYYQRKSSIMHTKEYTKYLQIIDAMEDVIHYYQEQGLYKKYYNELEYLTVYQILFFYVIHINKENDKSEVQHQLTDYVIKKFPKYFKNPYYRVCFGKKERLILFFIRKSQFKLLRKCFDIKKKIDLLLKR